MSSMSGPLCNYAIGLRVLHEDHILLRELSFGSVLPLCLMRGVF